ncbi:hypothetical protein [Thermosipho africanus]|uniref:hypothetical protein n=1 Tax=Thermosipho africanus TaxID=2421 RepID=UPI00147463A7|nr:hypothetical protein [Thermosipho africanus]
MRGMNERKLKAQITYMLLGQQLTILIDTLSVHPKMIRLIENNFYIGQGIFLMKDIC